MYIYIYYINHRFHENLWLFFVSKQGTVVNAATLAPSSRSLVSMAEVSPCRCPKICWAVSCVARQRWQPLDFMVI